MKPRHDRAAPGSCCRYASDGRHGSATCRSCSKRPWPGSTPKPGGRYCDATLGAGGHARAVLERSAPDGRLVGLDRDPAALATAGARLEPFGDRVTLVHARFSEARAVLERLGMMPVDGFLVDLGVSSPQLDRPERGFSFRHDGPLDMRMDPTQRRDRRRPAAPGGRRRADAHHPRATARSGTPRGWRARSSRRASRSRSRRPGKLAAIVARALPRHERDKNPATRTFQALRIAVNDELGELERFLDGGGRLPAPGRAAGA